MRFSTKVNLWVVLIYVILCSACTPRLASAPLVVDPPSAPTATRTSTPPATPAAELPAPVDPTVTPTVEICQTSLVKAIPVYDENGLLKSFDTSDNFVVLTIDDGYNDEVLNQMLDILE